MKKVFIPFMVALCIALGIVIGNFYSKLKTQKQLSLPFDRIVKTNDKISDVLDIIEEFYVDTIVRDSLVEQVIPEIISQLDPHSSYIPAKDLQMVNEELSGSFFGIGVQFNLQNDTIYVINVISGGPSEKVGIMAGDRIVRVNDSVFVGKKVTNEKVISTLRGDKGTKIKLGIVRRGSKEITNYVVTRGEVPVSSIDIGYMITPKIGYISVNKFGETTYKEFLNALTNVKQQGAKSVIVDLRGNAGGYLGAAVEMLNEFLKKDDLIVYMQGAHQKRVDSYADGTGSFQNMKMAVIIDEFSGSASEIFAGAIQDNDRGTIIGRRSFGKGLVQKPIRLRDESEIRLTVAKYYTPSGRCIQKPYSKGNIADYEMDLINRFNHGEFYSRDSIKENTTEVYHTQRRSGGLWRWRHYAGYLRTLRYGRLYQIFHRDSKQGIDLQVCPQLYGQQPFETQKVQVVGGITRISRKARPVCQNDAIRQKERCDLQQRGERQVQTPHRASGDSLYRT